MLDVGGTILIVNLISAVLALLVVDTKSPSLALLASLSQTAILLYAFRRNYGLEWGNLAAFFGMYFILSCVLAMLPLLAFVGVAGIVGFFVS